jgi:hypothetical protein
MRLRWFGTAGVALALVAALAGSCLLELEHEIACGDGYVDPLSGEECDPAVPSSYVDKCAGTSRPEGEAACDPVTCTIVNDKEQCAVCGDDNVDEELGEECDGSNLRGRRCPGGGDGLQCSTECLFDFAECEPCGNGMVEGEEECDPEPGGFVTVRPCAGADETEPLEPITKPYASGNSTRCDGCRYNRTQCGFCGDGVLDDGTEPVDFGVYAPAEWCDGDQFDQERLDMEFGTAWCTDDGQRVNAGCESDCRSFIDRTDVALCCLKKSETCPAVGVDIRCCYEYDHPDEEPCEEFFEGMTIRRVCK